MCEVLWLKKLLNELQVTIKSSIKLYYNNKVKFNISFNPIQHDKTKQVEIDRRFIKKKIEDGIICMTYVPTKKTNGRHIHLRTSQTELQCFHLQVRYDLYLWYNFRGSVKINRHLINKVTKFHFPYTTNFIDRAHSLKFYYVKFLYGEL